MKIKIKKLKLFGYHGVTEEEKKNGQDFMINMELRVKYENNIDSIENTVDYVHIINKTTNVFNRKKYNLLESLIIDIGDSILADKNVRYVKISIQKPNAPVKANFDFIEVSKKIYND